MHYQKREKEKNGDMIFKQINLKTSMKLFLCWFFLLMFFDDHFVDKYGVFNRIHKFLFDSFYNRIV